MSKSLESLTAIRTRLDALRADRASYIKATDVEAIFYKVQDLTLEDGTAVVKESSKQDNSQKKPLTQWIQIVSDPLDQVLLLIALFYMTVGKNREPPAGYAICTVFRILLCHLTESGVYSRRDLKPVERKLHELETNISQRNDSYKPHMINIYTSIIDECHPLLKQLLEPFENFTPQLEHIYEQLVSIRRQVTSVGARQKFVAAEITELQDKLKDIENNQLPQALSNDDDDKLSGPRAMTKELLDQCNEVAAAFAARKLVVNPAIEDTYLKLSDAKGKLEKLALTQAWSLRETDIFDYLQILRDVDEKRVDGKFVDAQGNAPEETQKILLYLLRRSYATTYELLNSSEPVSEALQPVYNQLSTLRKCLLELTEVQLASIDNLRPEGQETVSEILAECFNICHDLRREVEA